MNTSLAEDQKQFRKLRKLLRQIEHLQLLTRPLNDEEKAKLAKRVYYRERLNELTSIYRKGELYADSTFDTEPSLTSAEASRCEVEQICDEEEEDEQEQPNESSSALPAAGESDIDMLTSKLSGIVIDEQQSAPAAAEVKQTATETKSTAPVQPPVAVKKKPVKPKVTYDFASNQNVHEDLILSVDVNVQFGLVVTGSRDTTVKLWQIDSNDTQLVHSFGGHRSSVTMVKFFSRLNFNQVLDNLRKTGDDEDLLDTLANFDSSDYRRPLVVSSSLDCSIRLWCVEDANPTCVKEFYLYNPINYFDISGTKFIFGLDAGKIEYWNNFRKVYGTKSYEDADRVFCVKFSNKNDRKFFTLAQNGLLKVFKINQIEAGSFDLDTEIDCYSSLLSKDDDSSLSSMKPNFKCFELIDDDDDEKILMINDNQSFVILYDLRQIFASGREETSNAQTCSYEFTLENPTRAEHSYCISTIAASTSSSSSTITIVAGSNRNLDVWFVSYSQDAKRANKVKYVKMSKSISLNDNDWLSNESNMDESDLDDVQNRSEHRSDKANQEDERSSTNNQSKRCILQ